MSAAVAWGTWALWRALRAMARAAAQMGRAEVAFWLRRERETARRR